MTTTTDASTLEHRIGPAGRLQVRMMSGSIAIRAVEGETVRVRERNGRSLAEAFRIETGADNLSLTSNEKFGGVDFIVFSIGRRSGLALEIDVPRGTSVGVDSASAEISLSGLVGAMKIRTASGDIRLEDVRGSLELDAVSGDTHITANGPLDLRARSISGDVTLLGPRLGRATLETTSGDVRMDALLQGPGPFEIQTVSGDATIVGRSGLSVEARTVTGDLRSELPNRRDSGRGRKVLIVGDGATPLAFRSVSGDLRVTAPRDAATPAAADASTDAPLAPAPPSAPQAPTVPVPAVPAVPPLRRAAETADVAREAGHEVARLDVLRALERGEMSVEAAMARIADIEEA
ncbi:MAG: DUF4097 family beta strand repeat-containing protein [Chloroflexota bacterium]